MKYKQDCLQQIIAVFNEIYMWNFCFKLLYIHRYQFRFISMHLFELFKYDDVYSLDAVFMFQTNFRIYTCTHIISIIMISVSACFYYIVLLKISNIREHYLTPPHNHTPYQPLTDINPRADTQWGVGGWGCPLGLRQCVIWIRSSFIMHAVVTKMKTKINRY